ncbi:aldehyde dehydrogenase family protein [Microbaculum marinum]|uniref:Aldehyde dehydrogenase family protein n=1 Tax=Microbaculum marinum TaxID=1764581 RepID=A0AAW9RXL0_9HYPH
MNVAAETPPPALSQATTDFLSARHGLVIDGEAVASESGQTMAVIDPATGEPIAHVPAGTAADIDRAVSAARAAFEGKDWSALRPADRERLLLRLADEVEAQTDVLAELECLDNGKTLAMAKRVDVRGAVEFFRYIAGWATKLEGSTVDVSFPRPRQGEYFAFTRKEPVGVVGAIIPWNFPLLMAAWKIGPALAAGCTVVLKPAEETPLTALYLAKLLEKVGCPKGVVNVVTGTGEVAGAALSAHPDVDKVAFTGSTEVGKLVGKAAMDNMTRVSLELGGKSPVIVLDDADTRSAVFGASNAIFFNHGQVCTAGSRLYVHDKIFDAVVEGICEYADKVRLGPGLDPDTQMGPLVSQKQLDRVTGYIRSGLEDGARLAAGGSPDREKGYFVRPTVLVDAGPDTKVVREEIFGPVLVASRFSDIDDIARVANDTPFGLAASIWSRDLSNVHRLVPRLKVGTVWVNCHGLIDPALPFGGYKQSGIGREMGRAVMDMYTETKSVCMLV